MLVPSSYPRSSLLRGSGQLHRAGSHSGTNVLTFFSPALQMPGSTCPLPCRSIPPAIAGSADMEPYRAVTPRCCYWRSHLEPCSQEPCRLGLPLQEIPLPLVSLFCSFRSGSVPIALLPLRATCPVRLLQSGSSSRAVFFS